jgi:hypothetical protein
VRFSDGRPVVEGADPTLGDVILEGGALVVENRLRLSAPDDRLFFRVRSGARLRSLELRIRGTGPGSLTVAEKTFWTPERLQKQNVGRSFHVRIPWSYATSGGGDIRVAAGDGALELVSLALVPPGEPEDVIRLR